ncbi:MAG: hypothetical protein AAF664_12430 [Planctomycetota bacterium]
MQITKKSLLVEMLSGLQVVCLTIALVGGAFWVRASVQRIVRNQVVSDNRLIAEQMSKLIRSRSDIVSVDFGSSSWNQLQSLIEEVTLPNEGYMCVADARDGRLICHPKIRTNPELRGIDVAQQSIAVDGSVMSIRKRIGDSAFVPFTGTVGRGNATEVVSVAALPQLESVLFVHQRESGFRKAVNLVLLHDDRTKIMLGIGVFEGTQCSSRLFFVSSEDSSS